MCLMEQADPTDKNRPILCHPRVSDILGTLASVNVGPGPIEVLGLTRHPGT